MSKENPYQDEDGDKTSGALLIMWFSMIVATVAPFVIQGTAEQMGGWINNGKNSFHPAGVLSCVCVEASCLVLWINAFVNFNTLEK